MVECPCHHCTTRNDICHSVCEQYMLWQKAHNELKASQKADRLWYEYARDRDYGFIKGRRRNKVRKK